MTTTTGGFYPDYPPLFDADIGHGHRLLAFHGSPRSATDIITSTTPPDELDAVLVGAPQQLLAGGHTHVPTVRRHGSQTIINPGSVGLPFDTYGDAGEVAVLPEAAYGIISTTTSGLGIEFRQVAIDGDELARRVHASDMPHPEWWLSLRR